MTVGAAPRIIPLYLGYLSILGTFWAPKETFVAVETAIRFMQVVYAGFFAVFSFLPAFFFEQKVVKAYKDKIGDFFMFMFAFQGLALFMANKDGMFPVLCATNAALCYIGLHGGEKPNAPKVLPIHILPHVGLLFVCSVATLSAII